MNIGLVKEIKNNESRVGLTPGNVHEYTAHGHSVYVQKDAGINSGFSDQMYIDAGAFIVETAKEAWDQDMVVKVKEPLAEEYQYFKEGLFLFTYLHLAAEPELTKALVEKKVIAVAYETVQIGRSTPLLRPMSEVAGRRSITVGAQFLERINGGKGILIGGTPGSRKARVCVVGGGIAGYNAAQMATGLGADVTILEIDEDKIRELSDYFKNTAKVLKSTKDNITNAVVNADLVISTVLIPGAKAPKLVTREMVEKMEAGSVIVDVSIDQGGSVETVDRISTHDNPVYEHYGVLHYSVANMPGAVAQTSTIALTNATLNYGLLLADKQTEAFTIRPELAKGVNAYFGKVTNKAVAVANDYEFYELNSLI